MKQVLNAINLPRIVLTHTFGPKHKVIHRIIVGTIIAFIGTCITEAHGIVYHFMGGVFHAAGIVPHLDWAIETGRRLGVDVPVAPEDCTAE